MICFVYGLTFCSAAKFAAGFWTPKEHDDKPNIIYSRLQTIYQKNKFGYNTRIMSDFDLLLTSMLNERFIEESTGYYDDPITSQEIEDVELGLNGDLAQADVKHLLKDKSDHPSSPKCTRFPGRFGSNYPETDDLSIYKVVPKH